MLFAFMQVLTAHFGVVREMDGLVHTVEEVDLDPLQKYFHVWKMDMDERRGSVAKLETLLAQKIMMESAQLMKNLRIYATDDIGGAGSIQNFPMYQQGEAQLSSKFMRP